MIFFIHFHINTYSSSLAIRVIKIIKKPLTQFKAEMMHPCFQAFERYIVLFNKS